jgi:hypothetical protein
MSRKSIYALAAVALGLSCLVSSAASAGHGAGGQLNRPSPKINTGATVVCTPCLSHLKSIQLNTPNPPLLGVTGIGGGSGGGGLGHIIATHH